jgi:hypothetical protein
MRFDNQFRRDEFNFVSCVDVVIFVSSLTDITLGHRFYSFPRMNYQNRYEA